MRKMIWLYRCAECTAELVILSDFTRDEGPPAKAVECSNCEMVIMQPESQLGPGELETWKAGWLTVTV